jgi:acyl-CoA synthetase (AMP-forming)/AMP-acid ligase II/thioesterase domain-containing protein/acyl carrier protein
LDTSVTETIGDVIRRHAAATPDSPALVVEGQSPLTYRALADLLDRTRERLNAAGFGRGDRIAIVGPNSPATATLVTGILGCATAVPMNPALSVGEFAIYLRDLKVQAVAVDSAMDNPVRAAAREIGLPILEVEHGKDGVAGTIDIRPTSKPATASRPGAAQADDFALVLATSGTTSHSKVVPVTHRQYSTKFVRAARGVELTEADRCLSLMPLFHANGLYSVLGATLYAGGSIAFLPEFSVPAFFGALVTLAPTWYAAIYTFHHSICAAAPNHADAVKSARLRFIRTGSGALAARVTEELEALFRAPVIETYSSTETGRISATPLPPILHRPGTVGIPDRNEVAILGPDDRFLSPGERGEVVVRSAEVFSGYENDPAANARCLIDGWYRTGDEGVFDEDGYLTLTGRIKDIINRGGEKITPSEVDDALLQHPDVAAAVTFPVPHATLGQDVAAAVVPVKGTKLTDEILTNFLRRRLAAFKLPRRFVIVDEIPKGPTGKFERRKLAEAFDLVIDSAIARPEPTKDDRPATALEVKLRRLWQETLRLERVGLHEDFFMLGGDSLQAVELFLRVEKEFGRRLPRSVLFEADTVAKMAEHIEAVVPSSCIVPIQATGDLPPFFCVHDGYGQVLSYRELSRFLGENQPFYGIQARGIDGEEEPFVRIEDMAAHYVKEIRKVQPEGPYYIGGHSMGGRVAYLMAQQLQAAGQDVAFLGLFDTYSGYGQRKIGKRDWLARHLERIKSIPPGRLPGYLWLRVLNLSELIYLRVRFECYSAAWNFYKSRGKPLPRFLYRVEPATDMVRRSNYQPQPFDGDATLFKCELFTWTHTDAHDGWKELIRGTLDIRPLPGGHNEIMRQPHVRTVAAELADALAKARSVEARHIRISAKAS